MSLYSPAPPARPWSEDKPTVLVCWWITAFCTTFILLRVTGRLIRVEKLFREDKIAAAALIPLFIRMACVHVVLLYGTNNVELDVTFSEGELYRRSIGSRLVLLSRIFYPATLWTLKAATLEFFRRLDGIARDKSSARALMAMRCTLLATFLAVVISDLAECRPFANLWRVAPDPGGQCRQGYANLLTLAICNIVTDLLLVVYPVPIIIASRIPRSRKISLIGLFSLDLVTVVISIYRLPQILSEDGYQATRSMWASVEILVATVAANTLALASFVRDLGVKKAKFKFDPVSSERSRRGPIRPDYDVWHGSGLESDSVQLGNAANCASNRQSGFGKTVTKTSLDMNDSKSTGDRGHSPTRSVDSLIPRADASSNVTKTTEIEVTVVDVGTIRWEQSLGRTGGLYLTTGGHMEPNSVVPAGDRGRSRGSTVIIRDMDGLPKYRISH